MTIEDLAGENATVETDFEIDLTDYDIAELTLSDGSPPDLPGEPEPDDGERPRKPFRAAAFEYGEQLALRISGRYRFAPGMGLRRYNGAFWEEATEGELVPEIREMIAAYAPTVLRRNGAEGAKALAAASSGGGIAGILKVVKGWEGILTKDADFDRPRPPERPDDPHLFPCENGITIELYDNGTWKKRKSRPDDLMTKAGCAYDPEATADFTGLQFAQYQPDEEIRRFLMRVMVGTLRGIQIQHLFVWYGEMAGNGKGTMQAVFSDVFGGYCRTIPVQALMRSKAANEYRDEIAGLKGARLVFADEPEEGSRFAPGFVSRITGGSEISARGMYSKSISFVPTWSLVMPTNKRPGWGDHSGLARRYNEVAWDFQIPREQMTESVKDRMRAEAPGVLNQLLEYWPSFCEIGIAVPDVIKDQSAAGIRASDAVSRFIQECTVPAIGQRTGAREMYLKYKQWCDDQNERPETQTRFSGKLKRTFKIDSIRSNGNWFLDIALAE
jgi:P4 family phage/plasmid primase-like protien